MRKFQAYNQSMKEEHMNSLDKMEEEKMREAFEVYWNGLANDSDDQELLASCRHAAWYSWKAAIAHANSKHSTILEDYDRLAKLCEKQAEEIVKLHNAHVELERSYIERLSAATATIAMQAEALKAVMRLDSYFNEHAGLVGIVKTAITASAESVAAWKAKKHAQWNEESNSLIVQQNIQIGLLQRNVAMQDWALKILIPLARGNVADHKFAPNSLTATQCEQAASVIREVSTQATAEAYEREHAAKVLEEQAELALAHIDGSDVRDEAENKFLCEHAKCLKHRAAELRATNKEQGK